MPDDIMAEAVNEIEAIASFIKDEVVEGALEVRDFAVGAVSYESQNISPQFLKLVADCMAAAEQSLANETGAAKYEFAFSNAVAIAGKDSAVFVESAFDSAVQYVIAERNKRRAAKTVAAATASEDDGHDPAPVIPV